MVGHSTFIRRMIAVDAAVFAVILLIVGGIWVSQSHRNQSTVAMPRTVETQTQAVAEKESLQKARTELEETFKEAQEVYVENSCNVADIDTIANLGAYIGGTRGLLEADIEPDILEENFNGRTQELKDAMKAVKDSTTADRAAVKAQKEKELQERQAQLEKEAAQLAEMEKTLWPNAQA